MEPIVIYCTVPTKKEATEIAKHLVAKKYAACVSIIDKVHSVFSWDGEMCEENELLLIIKTEKERFDRVKETINDMHSYNIPEVIALPIVEGSENYLQWIHHELTKRTF